MKKVGISAVVFLMVWLIGCTGASSSSAQVVNIDASKMQSMMADTSIVVIDVRTPEEIAQGYIKGANMFLDYRGGQFEKGIANLDKKKTYILYCRSGGRSSSAADYMLQLGFTNVYNLTGGITNYSGEIKK